MTLQLYFWNGKARFIPAKPITVGYTYIDVHAEYPKHNIYAVNIGEDRIAVYLTKKV